MSIERLLQCRGLDIKAKDHYGRAPLYYIKKPDLLKPFFLQHVFLPWPLSGLSQCILNDGQCRLFLLWIGIPKSDTEVTIKCILEAMIAAETPAQMDIILASRSHIDKRSDDYDLIND